MRFYGLALVASAFVFGGCGGNDAAATVDTAGTAMAETPAGGAAMGTATAAPVTGEVHTVTMHGDEKGYYFEPANLTIKQGDGVKFVVVSMPPHNVAFENVPEGAKAQLNANMPNPMSELSSQMLLNPNDELTISFANIPAGKYDYVCTPHLAMNMRGSITVQ